MLKKIPKILEIVNFLVPIVMSFGFRKFGSNFLFFEVKLDDRVGRPGKEPISQGEFYVRGDSPQKITDMSEIYFFNRSLSRTKLLFFFF